MFKSARDSFESTKHNYKERSKSVCDKTEVFFRQNSMSSFVSAMDRKKYNQRENELFG